MLDDTVPAIQINAVGDIYHQQLELSGVINSANHAKYELKLTVKHSDMPESCETQTISGGKFSFNMGANKIHNKASHQAVLEVIDSASQKLLYQNQINWKLPTNMENRWLNTVPRSLFAISYYPTMNKLGLSLDNPVPDYEVKVIVSQNKEIIAAENFQSKDKKLNASIGLPKLTDGIYEVKAEIVKNHKTITTLSKSFERINFPWENNSLGISEQVYSPFTALQYHDNHVAMVLREYEFNALGLLENIQSKGKSLLANGMFYGYNTPNGKWQFTEGKWLRQSGNIGVYQSKAQGDGFLLKSTSTIEYDGAIKVELELIPDKNQTPLITDFYLDIPLRSNLIKLFHIIQSSSIRNNPAIKVPAGENVIWKSTDNSNGDMLGNMHPYLWLGEMDRGIAWFGDNDKNYSVDDNKPVQMLIRHGEKLILRVYFVNKPFNLRTPRKLVYGMQVSPAKPMPVDWRKPAMNIPPHGGSNPYWGIRPAFSGKYPVNNDWSFVDAMVKARETGNIDNTFIETWHKKNYANLNTEMQKYYLTHARGGHQNMMASIGKNPTMLYFEEHAQDQTTPEWKIFQDEWNTEAYSSREWMQEKDLTNSQAICRSGEWINSAVSYQNFALWYAKKWLEHGIGIYCDNTFPRDDYDPNTSDAYLRPDGLIQPSASIWNLRDYHKRLWVLAREMQKYTQYPLMINLHITNGMIIPVTAWTDAQLDLEWSWAGGVKPFPPELLEIESTGRQNGAYPNIHYTVLGNENVFKQGFEQILQAQGAVNPEMVKTEWAMRMIFELLRQNIRNMDFSSYNKIVNDFGYGTTNCKVINYWEDDYPVKADNPDIKSIYLCNGNKIMLIFASWSDKPCVVNVNLSGREIKSAINGFDGKKIDLENGNFKLDFGRYGMFLVSLEMK